SREKTTTIFIDGDRGGELIAKELLQTCEVDFVARAPPTREVEELPHKLVMKCLKNKLTAEQFVNQMGINLRRADGEPVGRSAENAIRREGGRDERREEPRGERRDEG